MISFNVEEEALFRKEFCGAVLVGTEELLALVETLQMLGQIFLEEKPPRTHLYWTVESCPCFLVNIAVLLQVSLRSKDFLTNFTSDCWCGLLLSVSQSLVPHELGPLLQGDVAEVAGVAIVDPLVPLQLRRELEELHALAALVGKPIPCVLQLVEAEEIVFVELLVTDIAEILLHFVNLLHVLPQTVLVGKGMITLVTLHWTTGRLQSIMIYLLVSLEMGLPSEVFITEITFEGSLTRVSQHMSLQTTWSGECLLTAWLGTPVEVDTGTAGRELEVGLTL